VGKWVPPREPSTTWPFTPNQGHRLCAGPNRRPKLLLPQPPPDGCLHAAPPGCPSLDRPIPPTSRMRTLNRKTEHQPTTCRRFARVIHYCKLPCTSTSKKKTAITAYRAPPPWPADCPQAGLPYRQAGSPGLEPPEPLTTGVVAAPTATTMSYRPCPPPEAAQAPVLRVAGIRKKIPHELQVFGPGLASNGLAPGKNVPFVSFGRAKSPNLPHLSSTIPASGRAALDLGGPCAGAPSPAGGENPGPKRRAEVGV